MSEEIKKEEKSLYCIEIINTVTKKKGFVIIHKEEVLTANMLTKDVTFFSSSDMAQQAIRKHKLHDRKIHAHVKKVLDSEIIKNNPNIVSASSIKKDLYFVVGTTNDGKKLWMHFDTEKDSYMSKSEVLGACAFEKQSAENLVTHLTKNFSSMVKEWSLEMIDKANIGEITIK